LKLEVIGSHLTDEKFMVQIYNSLTVDYESQILWMEKRIGNKENPLRIDTQTVGRTKNPISFVDAPNWEVKENCKCHVEGLRELLQSGGVKLRNTTWKHLPRAWWATCGITIGLFFSKKNPGHVQVLKSHNK
jgi:hypothetical protein